MCSLWPIHGSRKSRKLGRGLLYNSRENNEESEKSSYSFSYQKTPATWVPVCLVLQPWGVFPLGLFFTVTTQQCHFVPDGICPYCPPQAKALHSHRSLCSKQRPVSSGNLSFWYTVSEKRYTVSQSSSAFVFLYFSIVLKFNYLFGGQRELYYLLEHTQNSINSQGQEWNWDTPPGSPIGVSGTYMATTCCHGVCPSRKQKFPGTRIGR